MSMDSFRGEIIWQESNSEVEYTNKYRMKFGITAQGEHSIVKKTNSKNSGNDLIRNQKMFNLID